MIRQDLAPGCNLNLHDAETPAEAMSLLLSQPFDLLVADWEIMIAQEGAFLELVARRARLARRKMPALVLMTQPTQASVLHASNNGIDMILGKPFSPKMLQQRVFWLLRHARGQASLAG